MRALIIDEPWISLILSGRKTWEMRKRTCNIRGPIALIRKGSGQVVGTARVVDSRPPIASAVDYAKGERFHRIPLTRQLQAMKDGWATPWVLAEARAFARPVPYSHPSGAVIWVTLAPDVARKVESQARASAKAVKREPPTLG